MAKHLLRDLENLKKELLLLGSMVEDATHKAVLSLIDRRADLAQEVIEGDDEVDEREVEVDENALKLLALHQPVAADLRFVVAAMKVNNDLERVGDLAGNLAGRAAFLAEHDPITVPKEIETMADDVRSMLRDSLSAFVHGDTDLARKVLHNDEAVDQQHKDLYSLLGERMQAAPETLELEMQLLSVSRYLERIADLATNIAEDVVFMVDGDVVRHRSW
ncbi:MAG: phosphate signaling complex protein PhoU [Acidobacteriota bacterium]